MPLHVPDLAVRELTRAVTETGLHGVEISTTAGGRDLADPDFEPFWARAAELGAVVFIHPWGCSLAPRLDQHYLANIVGQPTETTVALSHLIFSGMLDRHPGLRIIAAHGGGYLPFYIGRSDHAWEHRPDARIPREKPSEYLRRIYFDSLVYQPAALAALIAQVGIDRVLLGTDFPFDMGVEDPLDRLDAVPGLEAQDRAAIRGGNAAALLAQSAAAWLELTLAARLEPRADEPDAAAEMRLDGGARLARERSRTASMKIPWASRNAVGPRSISSPRIRYM